MTSTTSLVPTTVLLPTRGGLELADVVTGVIHKSTGGEHLLSALRAKNIRIVVAVKNRPAEVIKGDVGEPAEVVKKRGFPGLRETGRD